MTGSDRVVTSRHLRGLIDVYVKGCKPGTRIQTLRLARQLSDNRRFITLHRISIFLREREDLRHTGRNEWLVVA